MLAPEKKGKGREGKPAHNANHSICQALSDRQIEEQLCTIPHYCHCLQQVGRGEGGKGGLPVSGWQLLAQLQLGFSCVAHKAVGRSARCQWRTKSGHWSSAAAVHLLTRIEAPFVGHFNVRYKIVINFQSRVTAAKAGEEGRVSIDSA